MGLAQAVESRRKLWDRHGPRLRRQTWLVNHENGARHRCAGTTGSTRSAPATALARAMGLRQAMTWAQTTKGSAQAVGLKPAIGSEAMRSALAVGRPQPRGGASRRTASAIGSVGGGRRAHAQRHGNHNRNRGLCGPGPKPPRWRSPRERLREHRRPSASRGGPRSSRRPRPRPHRAGGGRRAGPPRRHEAPGTEQKRNALRKTSEQNWNRFRARMISTDAGRDGRCLVEATQYQSESDKMELHGITIKRRHVTMR